MLRLEVGFYLLWSVFISFFFLDLLTSCFLLPRRVANTTFGQPILPPTSVPWSLCACHHLTCRLEGLVRRSYGEVVGREEAPWWQCKRRVKSGRRVRDVWFPKLKGKSFKG